MAHDVNALHVGAPSWYRLTSDPNLTGLRGDPAFDRFAAGLRQEWERRRQALVGEVAAAPELTLVPSARLLR
jgi:hypothetical protein